MSYLPRTPPRQVRVAVILMWTVLPFGLITTAINTVAFLQTRAFLPDALVTTDAAPLDVALRHFEEFGPRRILTIAMFFVVGALAFAALGRIARRGTRCHPAGVMLLTGGLIAAYAVGLFWAYRHDPIDGFQYEIVPVYAGRASNAVPWTMDVLAPNWYYGTLALTLTVAGAAPAAGGFLLTRPGAAAWIGGRAGGCAGIGAAREVTRRGGVLLALTPAVAVPYSVASAVAGAAASDGVTWPDFFFSNVYMVTVFTVAFGVVTLPWAFGGMRLLTNRIGRRAMMWLGAMTIPYSLAVLFACLNNPLSATFLGDRAPNIPAWYPAAIATFAAVALGWLITNLITLAGTRPPAGGP